MGFPHDETSLGDDKHHDSRNESYTMNISVNMMGS